MPSSLKAVINYADKLTKYTIFGYLRECKALDVPKMISYLIMAYFAVVEYFDKCDENVIKISDDKSTITNIKSLQFGKRSIVFCHQLIKKDTTSIWEFKINKLFGSSVMKFGVGCSNLNEHELNFIFRSDFYIPINNCCVCKKIKKGERMNVRDIVRLKLDLSNDYGSFICYVNDIEKMKYIKIEKYLLYDYKMAVACYNKGDSVTLIQYKELYG